MKPNLFCFNRFRPGSALKLCVSDSDRALFDRLPAGRSKLSVVVFDLAKRRSYRVGRAPCGLGCYCAAEAEPVETTRIVHKRSFAAAKTSGEVRERLNREALTSEYMPSYRYLVRWPGLMDDGSPNPAQPHHTREFRTKAEAEAFAATPLNVKPAPNLPPDIDGKNATSSRWARAAVAKYQRLTGVDDGDALGDLLSDLMHFCDRKEDDFGTFADALRRGTNHYKAETGRAPY